MDEVIVIQPSTITAIGDAIIDVAGITEPFDFRDVPRLIREDVYNKGYADGEANGTSDPVLYGTYMLKPVPNYQGVDTDVAVDLDEYEVYAYFHTPDSVFYTRIEKMSATKAGFNIINIDRDTTFTLAGSSIWEDGTSNYFNDMCRAIDFRLPVSVSQEFYDIFMSLVDNDDVPPVDIGRQAEYNEFWDAALDPSLNWQQRFTGAVWNDTTFKPNQDIKPTGYANNLFYLTAITDLAGILEDCGVVLDTSGINGRGDFLFYYNTQMTRIPYLDLSNITYQNGINNIFGYCYALHTVEGLRLRDDGNLTMLSSFEQCRELVNIEIYGTIGKELYMVHCTKLSIASLTSIMTALSTTTSGLSVTLSKTAVDTAFKNGNTPGSEAPDWKDLVLSRSNWTINLV